MRETVRQIRQRIALALQRFTLLRHFRVERGQRSRIGFLRQRFIGIRQISGQFRDGAVRSSQIVAQLCDGIGQILHRCRISLLATAALVVASPFSSWVVRLPVEVSRLPCCVTVVVSESTAAAVASAVS